MNLRTTLAFMALALMVGCASTPPPAPPAPAVGPPANVLADQAMNEGRHREAIDLYTQWLIDRPDDATAMFRRARCQEYVGDDAAAVEGYGRVIELRGDDLVARLRRAGCLTRLGQLPAAEQDLHAVIGDASFREADASTQVLALGLAGQLQLIAGNPGAAIAPLDEALRVAGASAGSVRAVVYQRLHYNRAAALFAIGAYDGALGSFEEFCATKQDGGAELDGEELYHLALLAYLAGRYDRARQVLPRLGAQDRQALAHRLHDPDFFLTDHELRALTAASSKER